MLAGRQLQGVAKIYRNPLEQGEQPHQSEKLDRRGGLQETGTLQLCRATGGRLLVVVGDRGEVGARRAVVGVVFWRWEAGVKLGGRSPLESTGADGASALVYSQ